MQSRSMASASKNPNSIFAAPAASPYVELKEIKNDAKDVIERNIHLVWLGSKLRDEHIERIIQWKKLNPNYNVTVWVDPEFESDIKTQLDKIDVEVKLVSTLKISEKLASLIQKVTQKDAPGIPNFAAASDGYRLRIVHDFGGWYVDTDIEPLDLSKIKINPQLKFHFDGKRIKSKAELVCPSVIAANSGNLLTEISLELFDAICDVLTDQIIKMIRSEEAFIRMQSTIYTTGFVLRGALGKININGKNLIEVENIKNKDIPNINIFDTVCTLFQNNFEQTWILKNTERSSLKCRYTPMEGVVLDERYVNYVVHNKPMPQAKEFYPIDPLRAAAFSKIRQRNISHPENNSSLVRGISFYSASKGYRFYTPIGVPAKTNPVSNDYRRCNI